MGGAVALVVGSYARIVNARSGLLRLGGELCRESMSDGIEIRQPDAYQGEGNLTSIIHTTQYSS